MDNDEQKIREVHTTWIDAVNIGDLRRLLALITDDVVMLNPGGEPLSRAGFIEKFSSALQEFRFKCISDLEEVLVSGDVAFTRSRDSLSIGPRGSNDVTQFAGYRMTVYRKQADGRWLLARDAHTLTPVAK
jgi:uncharacterized protein (TIGR02246 family)